MSDLFKRTELNFGGATAADRGILVPNKGLTGLLLQQLTLNYSQNVTRIYEIGIRGERPNVYYIGGRSQGMLNVAHIIGPRLTMLEFYDNFSDVCEAGTNDIKIEVSSECNEFGTFGPALAYNCKFCVLVSVGLAIAANDFVINSNSSLMFSNMEYSEDEDT